MAIQRLNHAVLYVRDLARSRAFYENVLGFRVVSNFPGAAFLQASGSTNDHDLGLFQIGMDAEDTDAGRRTVGMYHLAWEVDTLGEFELLEKVLTDAGSLVGSSSHGTTKSLYAKDPDGLEFEIAWIIPSKLLTAEDTGTRRGVHPLDIAAEIERFGRDEVGGVGISTPA
jgi:catechol 2,3-dioxygenase-like lactoylglutathione lyase family enzyme